MLLSSMLRYRRVAIFFSHAKDVGHGHCCTPVKGQWRSFGHDVRTTASLSSPSQRGSDSVRSSSGPIQQYNRLVAQGVLQHDAQQQYVAEALQKLYEQLKEYENEMKLYHAKLSDWEQKRQQLRQKMLRKEAEVEVKRQFQKMADEQGKGLISRWFSRSRSKKLPEPRAGRMVAHIKREKMLDSMVGSKPSMPLGPQGLYIYGNVGSGKTMLMDMFFLVTDGVVKCRRRLHFHAALLEVHDHMHKLWKQQQLQKKMDHAILTSTLSSSDGTASSSYEKAVAEWLDAEEKFESEFNLETTIFDSVAENLLGSIQDTGGGASLLCFDEMQVVDVFTAVALAGILGGLLNKGTIIVATSNRTPNDLNKEGLQKELFDKFITQLQKHCRLVLVGTEKDYRRVLAKENMGKVLQTNFFWPLDRQSELMLERRWQEFTKQTGGKVVSATIPVMFGRVLEVPESCSGAARFSFEQLCDRPVGAADYIALAQNFHTVFVTGIPVMSMRNRDKARRFITLIDELYNHHCQMICTAAASIDELFFGH